MTVCSSLVAQPPSGPWVQAYLLESTPVPPREVLEMLILVFKWLNCQNQWKYLRSGPITCVLNKTFKDLWCLLQESSGSAPLLDSTEWLLSQYKCIIWNYWEICVFLDLALWPRESKMYFGLGLQMISLHGEFSTKAYWLACLCHISPSQNKIWSPWASHSLMVFSLGIVPLGRLKDYLQRFWFNWPGMLSRHHLSFKASQLTWSAGK